MSTPTLFCLHALGSSSLEFAPVAEALGEHIAVEAIDLPGFGDASTATGTTVDEMVAHVVRAIRRNGSTRFMLVGHSMGGKVASLVAARILDGTSGIFGLKGVVLLAASPPTPEPMGEDRRAEMMSWAADGGPLDETAARDFVDANVGSPLDPEHDAQAIADVRRTSPEAWLAWLERGSREDRGADVGVLDVPAAIVAGGADGDLGPDAQRELNGAVYPRADVTVLDGAGHLLPSERPREVADVILRLWDEHAGRGPVIPDDFARVIGSSRTSSQTRAIHARRALADEPDHRPRTLTADQLTTLRAIADRVVPQGAEARDAIDVAARVDSQLARGHSDGWRNSQLPPDPEAYRLGLDSLDDFTSLDPEAQDARLQAIVDGEYSRDGAPFSAEQLNLWFEDCRVDLARTWLAHPATMARIGFDGFANGGDQHRIQGFQRLGAGEREGWEPRMLPVRAIQTDAARDHDTTTTEAAR